MGEIELLEEDKNAGKPIHALRVHTKFTVTEKKTARNKSVLGKDEKRERLDKKKWERKLKTLTDGKEKLAGIEVPKQKPIEQKRRRIRQPRNRRRKRRRRKRRRRRSSRRREHERRRRKRRRRRRWRKRRRKRRSKRRRRRRRGRRRR